ncbi:MAG: hypothetical protein ACOCQD_05100 [archaeon]
MNDYYNHIEQILCKFRDRNTTGYKYYKDTLYYSFWAEVNNELLEDQKLIYDGRRDDAFERTLMKMCDNNIPTTEFMNVLNKELAYYNDNILLVMPLNGLDKSVLPDVINFSDNNLKLFAVKESKRKINKDKTIIGEYVANVLRMSLGMGHTRFKDPGFYNSPVLTYIFKGVNDNIIYYHSQNIVQAAYAFIRMIEQDRDENNERWRPSINKFYASTYAIYYKSDYDKNETEINNGYGHQLKFFNSPILDINTNQFLVQKKLFEKMFINFTEILLTPKSCVHEKRFIAIKKLISAVRMWNTSYELASIERFDSTLLLLISILESLLLKNKGIKKKNRLADEVSRYLNEDQTDFIENIYSLRNDLNHEGKSVGTIDQFRLVEKGHNYFPGYKPFEQYSFWGYPEEIKEISELLILVKRVITKAILANDVLIGENSIPNSNLV